LGTKNFSLGLHFAEPQKTAFFKEWMLSATLNRAHAAQTFSNRS
jgi:hypothetical protein